MSYEILEKTYTALTEEQKQIVYSLVLSLEKMNEKKFSKNREFGKFAGKANASFSDNWQMTEEELCAL